MAQMVEHPLDPHHALRPAEAAEGGGGLGVGLPAVALDPHMVEQIGVVGMQHRPVRHRQRQVLRPAAAGVLHELDAEKPALGIRPGAVVDAEVVALAGHHHVVVAVVAHLGRPPGRRGPPRRRTRRARCPGFPCRRSRRPCGAPRRGPRSSAGRAPRRPCAGSRSGAARRNARACRHRPAAAPARPGPRGRNAPARRSRSEPSTTCGAPAIAAAASPLTNRRGPSSNRLSAASASAMVRIGGSGSISTRASRAALRAARCEVAATRNNGWPT